MKNFEFIMYSLIAFMNIFTGHICKWLAILGIPIQTILAIFKACEVGAFTEVLWTDPLLWIPLMIMAIAIPICFVCYTIGTLIFAFIDYEEK